VGPSQSLSHSQWPPSAASPDELLLPAEYERVVAQLKKRNEKGHMILALNEVRLDFPPSLNCLGCYQQSGCRGCMHTFLQHGPDRRKDSTACRGCIVTGASGGCRLYCTAHRHRMNSLVHVLPCSLGMYTPTSAAGPRPKSPGRVLPMPCWARTEWSTPGASNLSWELMKIYSSAMACTDCCWQSRS